MATGGVFAEGGEHTAGVLAVMLGGGGDGARHAARDTPAEMSNVIAHVAGRVSHAQHAGGLVEATPSPATVWASSLDGAPLRVSRRILVTHLTDVQNTGAEYADAWTTSPLSPPVCRIRYEKCKKRLLFAHEIA